MIYEFGHFDAIQNQPLPSSDATPLFQVHDPSAPDITTAQKIAREALQIAGAVVHVHARTDNSDIRAVHDEDPDPTYWPPVVMKGYFAPKPMEYELKEWGLDSDNKVEITFALPDVYEQFHDRLLRIGDVIEIPYNSLSRQKPKYYAIDNAQEFGNFRYTWLYLKCQASLLLGDPNLMPDGGVIGADYA